MLITGLFIGCLVGVFAMALVSINRSDDYGMGDESDIQHLQRGRDYE